MSNQTQAQAQNNAMNAIKAVGEYYERINGGEWVKSPNLVTDEGLSHMLNVAFGSTPNRKPTMWLYMGRPPPHRRTGQPKTLPVPPVRLCQ